MQNATHAARVLVLDGDSGTAVEALQSLARDHIEVDVAGPDDALILASRWWRRSFHQPLSDDPEEFLSWLRELDQENGYALIIPATENALWPLSNLSDADPLRHKAVLPSPEALDTAQDRAKLRAMARQCGLAIPEGRVIEWIDTAPAAVRFPVLLTPARNFVSSSGRLRSFESVIAHDEEQRRAHLSFLLRHVPVLEQECTSGERWGLTLLYERGRLQAQFAHRRLHEVSSGGACSYRRSAFAPDGMLRDATRLLDALRWHGVATVEFLRTDDGRSLLASIRPVLDDSLALIRDAGVELPQALLRVARDEPLPPPHYRVPHTTRSVRRDATWILRQLREGNILEGVIETLKALCPWLAGESWDNFEWNDLDVTRAILRELWNTWRGRMEERMEMRVVKAEARRVHQANLKNMVTGGRTLQRMLFLCYGNICRSPVAAALARRILPSAEISSAGFFAAEGRRSPDNIRWAAGQMGLDSSHWASRMVSDAMVEGADVIFVMDLYNFRDFRSRFRRHLHKVLLLGMFGDPPSVLVRDPYQKGPEETIRVLRQIELAIRQVASIFGEQSREAVASQMSASPH